MLNRIIISILVIAATQATTTLTTSNCPSKFNPNNYNNSLTHTNQNIVASLYANILDPELKANITSSIAKGDLSALTNKFKSTSFLLPYILICVFFGFLFLVTLCCCLFQRRCPPCKSWRRNYVKSPYSLCQRRVCMIFTVIFSAGTLITTIVVFSSFTLLRNDLNMIKCSMYYSLDVASNGDQGKSWGGFGQVQTQLSSITGLISTTASEANSSLWGNQWILSGYTTMQNMNINLWENNKDSKVLTPDPIATQSTIPIPKITPRFIQQGLGPNGTANTMITDIDNGFKVIKQLTNQAQATFLSAMTFANSASNIAFNTNENLASITVVTTLLSSLKISLQTFVKDYISYAVDIGIYAMEAAFGLILLGSIISLLGVISTHIFDLFTCKKMVNGGWILFGFIYFAVVGVMMLFLIVGGVSQSFCSYFGQVINTQAKYNSYVSESRSNSMNKLFNYMDVCFFGDGNILKKFSVSAEMLTVADLFENTQTFLNMQTSGNAQYIDLTTSTSKILGWMSAMSNYGYGIYVDADSSIVTEDNPDVALFNFNQLTLQDNSTGRDHICANDYWVFDYTNCSKSSEEALYSPSTDNTNGLYFPPTGSLCISFNDRISTSAPSIWTSSDIAQRYLSHRSCDSGSNLTYEKILLYAESLTNYRDSRKNLYQSLYDQLNSILLVNSQYNTNMSTFSGNLNTFFSTASTLNNYVTNQINGLTISANCTAIADSLRFFYNMYCVNFVNRSVKIVVCCIALLILMTGAVLSGSIFGVWFKRIQKERVLSKIGVESEVFQEQESDRTQQSAGSNQDEDNN